MSPKRAIARPDVLSPEAFERERAVRRERLAAVRRNRRVEVGPFATFSFESYDTMWWQVHEMLRIEGGGEGQIADELEAYNPLIPQGSELVATLMFEIDEPVRRGRELARLGGVEHCVSLRLGSERIAAVSADSEPRSTPEGRASSVHFLRLPFTAGDIARFRDARVEAVLAIDHPAYAHRAVIQPAVRAALLADFAD